MRTGDLDAASDNVVSTPHEALADVQSIPEVCEVARFGCDLASSCQILIEIPHGATRAAELEVARRGLRSALPEGIAELFFVNTDVGAPECARELAQQLVTGRGGEAVAVSVITLRSLLPRSLADCNRLSEASGGVARQAGVTPAIPDYVRDPADRRRLTRLHDAYQEVARAAYGSVCGAGGLALMLHTYAPRAVQIEAFDDGVVAAIRRAYTSESYHLWPERPAVELITRSSAGELLAEPGMIEAVRRSYQLAGIEVAENASYRLDPLTAGYRHGERWRGQVLCVELNRKLLVEGWEPFVENQPAAPRVALMVTPLADALRNHRAARSVRESEPTFR